MFDLELFKIAWTKLNREFRIAPLTINAECQQFQTNCLVKNRRISTTGTTEIGNYIFPSISLHIFQSIASTNEKSWELIDRDIALPAIAIALEQTAGKGQWGRQWVSHTGGLYLSLGISTHISLQNNAHLVMATAWGIANTLRNYYLPVGLKWSNDLILNRRKLGGIKIETRGTNSTITKAVIGVGINWQNVVPEVGINLQEYYQQNPENKINSLSELAAITAYGILFGEQYYQTAGIEKLLEKYLELSVNLGQKITWQGCPGIVTGVTTQGELKVKLRSPGATTEIRLSPGQISLGY